MQINFSIKRVINGQEQQFTGTAGSVEEAIKAADALAGGMVTMGGGVAGQTPQEIADMNVKSEHTPKSDTATSPQSKGDINVQDDAAAAKAKADADKKAKAEADKKAKAEADAKKNSPAPDASPGNTVSEKTNEADAGANKPDADEREYTYEEVRQKILAISKDKGREPTVAALAKFGVAAGKDLKPEQYSDAFKYFTDVIAGKIDPLKSEEADSEFA